MSDIAGLVERLREAAPDRKHWFIADLLNEAADALEAREWRRAEESSAGTSTFNPEWSMPLPTPPEQER